MNKYIRHFGSILDWANYSEKDQSTDAPSYQRASIAQAKSWKGCSKEQSYHLLKTGYPEGLARMRSILESIYNTITLVCPQYEFSNDIEGSSPDVQAYIEGRPDDMFFLSPVEKDAPPSFIRLQFELFVSCCHQPNQIMWASTTVFAAMECLRAQGCAVELLMTHTGNNCSNRVSGSYWQSQVPIPNNIDLDSLSFLLTHPSVFRVITFSVMEHEPEEIRQEMEFQGGCYSYPAILKHSSCDVLLSINTLAVMFSNYDDSQNLIIAQRVLKILVDTKLERIQ